MAMLRSPARRRAPLPLSCRRAGRGAAARRPPQRPPGAAAPALLQVHQLADRAGGVVVNVDTDRPLDRAQADGLQGVDVADIEGPARVGAGHHLGPAAQTITVEQDPDDDGQASSPAGVVLAALGPGRGAGSRVAAALVPMARGARSPRPGSRRRVGPHARRRGPSSRPAPRGGRATSTGKARPKFSRVRSVGVRFGRRSSPTFSLANKVRAMTTRSRP
jgi:hypothetical protein